MNCVSIVGLPLDLSLILLRAGSISLSMCWFISVLHSWPRLPVGRTSGSARYSLLVLDIRRTRGSEVLIRVVSNVLLEVLLAVVGAAGEVIVIDIVDSTSVLGVWSLFVMFLVPDIGSWKQDLSQSGCSGGSDIFGRAQVRGFGSQYGWAGVAA